MRRRKGLKVYTERWTNYLQRGSSLSSYLSFIRLLQNQIINKKLPKALIHGNSLMTAVQPMRVRLCE